MAVCLFFLLSLPLLILYFSVHIQSQSPTRSSPAVTTPRPVVIDTDIGSDIDDSYAIGFALRSPDLDVKLIVTSTDDTAVRAKIVAKLLTIAGRDDIPIGIGITNDNRTIHALWDWARDFNLSDYKGGVYEDGVDQMAKVILGSESIVEIIAIAPMTNFPYLLETYPDVVKKSRIRAMAGSIYRGYDNSSSPTDEYNVKICPYCAQKVFQANWSTEITMTPLDTCGVTYLTPSYYKPFIAASTPWTIALGMSELFFCTVLECRLNEATSPLYDTVATLLALPNAIDYLDLTELKLTVTDAGYTVVDDKNGVQVKVALNWNNNNEALYKFLNYLVMVFSQ